MLDLTVGGSRGIVCLFSVAAFGLLMAVFDSRLGKQEQSAQMENGNLRLKAGGYFSVLSVNGRCPGRGTAPGVSPTRWKYSLTSTCIVSTPAPSLSFTICLFSFEHIVTY